MSNLKAYLAANYMSGPKADAIIARHGDGTVKKKRKKKNEDYVGSVAAGIVQDQDVVRRDEEEEDDTPVIGKDVATFKKSKSSWATVGSSALPVPGPSSPPDIKPEIPDEKPEIPKKRKGGLRTGAQLRQDLEAAAAARRSATPPPQNQETVHRDASGRVVDVAKLKEEERALEREEERKKREREEWTKGVTQRKERENQARLEQEMSQRGVARYANDAAMNEELAQQERWNDPAAAFVSKRQSKGPRRPKYQGAHPLNRFNIPPGFRWDGVDRGTGFEKKYYQYRNAAARKEYADNQWSVEDM